MKPFYALHKNIKQRLLFSKIWCAISLLQKSRLTFIHKKSSLICYIQNITILMHVTQIQTKLTLTVQNTLRRTHRFHFKSDYEFYMTFNEFFTRAYPITLKFPHSYLDYIKNATRTEHRLYLCDKKCNWNSPDSSLKLQ